MKDIATDREYWIDGDELVPVVTRSTPLDGELEVWNLRSLAMLITADRIQDDAFRKEVLARIRRARRTAEGAIFGGLADALSGDDGILDGVLLGAAFGSLSPVGLEEPKATVGLLFSDGSYLIAEVDKHEYALLQTRVAGGAARLEGVKHAVRKTRPLTLAQKKAVIELRKEATAFTGVVLLLLLLFTLGGVSSCVAPAYVLSMEDRELFSRLYSIFAPIAVVAIFALMIWASVPSGVPRDGSQAADGAEGRRGDRPS